MWPRFCNDGNAPTSLVPGLLCGGGGKRTCMVHTVRVCAQVPLVTCILLSCTKITVNFCLPPERPHCMVILLVGHIRAVLKSKISF